MGWVKQYEDTRMPDWLKENLSDTCLVCGAFIENYYNDRNECTNRRCPNKKCPRTLAKKIASMCDILQVKGIAEGVGGRMIAEHNLQNHFEAVPYIFAEKPVIPLYQLLRLCFIEGVDTRWEAVCEGKSSVQELLDTYKGDLKQVILQNLDIIKYGETFFNIKKPIVQEFKPLVTGTVMISGHIKGFSDRDDFIRALNGYSKGLISLGISKNKRKTGIMCLIQEKDEPYRGKAECALANGIPIMSPKEFQVYVADLVKKKLEEKNNDN